MGGDPDTPAVECDLVRFGIGLAPERAHDFTVDADSSLENQLLGGAP